MLLHDAIGFGLFVKSSSLLGCFGSRNAVAKRRLTIHDQHETDCKFLQLSHMLAPTRTADCEFVDVKNLQNLQKLVR